ncbi:MAG TPA: hypothetical protein VMB72_02675 [Acidimicrobiales bacterium]|nr:hypothetical protein [Acidimicrobiales bacterium]
MIKRVVGSLALAGTMALGAAGTAAAAPAPHCTNASHRIARLQHEETQVSALLTRLEAVTPHGRRQANRLHQEIAALTRFEALLTNQVNRLQAQCPTSTTTGTGNTGDSGTSGTTGTGTTGTGNSGNGGTTGNTGSSFTGTRST